MTVKKIIFIGCAALVAIVIACLIVYRLLTTGRVEPLALLLLAAVITIMLPIIRINFFPSARDCDAEFAFHAQRLDAFVRQQIVDSLGEAAYQRIGPQPASSNEGPDTYLSVLLASQEAASNADLRFALLVALSHYHGDTGDHQAAIDTLAAAHNLRPQDFVTRFNLAQRYARQGNPDEARRIFRQIIDNPAGLSRAMIKLTRQHMEGLAKR